MSDDELLRPLRNEPPAAVMNDGLFFARIARDVNGVIDRGAARKKARRVGFGSFAAAAALALGVLLTRTHHPRHHAPLLETDLDEAPEASAGVTIEELSDAEITRAMNRFTKINGG